MTGEQQLETDRIELGTTAAWAHALERHFYPTEEEAVRGCHPGPLLITKETTPQMTIFAVLIVATLAGAVIGAAPEALLFWALIVVCALGLAALIAMPNSTHPGAHR